MSPSYIFVIIFLVCSKVSGLNFQRKAYKIPKGKSGELTILSVLRSESENEFLSLTLDVSSDCKNALGNISMNWSNLWVSKMLDASAKLPSGVLYGNLYNVGDRIACLREDRKNLREDESSRYYLIEFLLESGAYSHGFCVPRACTPSDMIYGLRSIFKGKIDIQIDDNAKRSEKFDIPEIILLCILAIISAITILGSALDVLCIKSSTEHLKVLRMFSFFSNMKDLFKISKPQTNPNSTKRLESLDGLRFISFTWILICHVYSDFSHKIADVLIVFKDLFNNYWGQTINNGYPSVDSFFLLSGLLVSYLTFKELDKLNGKLNWFLFYFHRYIRLTAVYGILIFFSATLYKYLDPQSTLITNEVQTCRKTFWKNVLYIDNLVLTEEDSCIMQTWYLNCDMQMFIISPILIYPLWRWRKIGYTLIMILTIASTSYISWIYYYHRNDWAFTFFGSDMGSFFKENYTVPWTRVQPYLIGITLGYVFYRNKCECRIQRPIVISAWTLAFIVGFSTVYGLNLHTLIKNNSFFSTPIFNRMAYGSLIHLSWAFALGWVIFACETENGGLINKFLSWEFFKPLSKITFLIYLIHLHVGDAIIANTHFTTQYSVILMFLHIINVLSISIFISIGIYVFLECPFTNVEKYLVNKARSPSNKVRTTE